MDSTGFLSLGTPMVSALSQVVVHPMGAVGPVSQRQLRWGSVLDSPLEPVTSFACKRGRLDVGCSVHPENPARRLPVGIPDQPCTVTTLRVARFGPCHDAESRTFDLCSGCRFGTSTT